MAKALYVGVGGVAKKGKKGYVGVGGVAKKIKKMYVGDANGKARLAWSGGGGYRFLISQQNAYAPNGANYISSTNANPPTSGYTSTGQPISSPAYILYDKKREQFILLSQYITYNSENTIYVMKRDANSWTSVGKLTCPSGCYIRLDRGGVSIDDDGNIICPAGNSNDGGSVYNFCFFKFYVENNSIVTGTKSSWIYNENGFSNTQITKPTKIDGTYAFFVNGRADYYTYLYTCSDIGGTFTAKKIFSDGYYNREVHFFGNQCPIQKYNGKYYVLAARYGGPSNSDNFYCASGTTFADLTARKGYCTTIRSDARTPFAFANGKFYISAYYGLSSSSTYSGLQGQGVYSINAVSSAWDTQYNDQQINLTSVATKESSSHCGPMTTANWYQLLYAYDGQKYLIVVKNSTDTSSYTDTYLFYTSDLKTFTAVSITSFVGKTYLLPTGGMAVTPVS